MTEVEACNAARSYATEYGVPWVGVTGVRKARAWWYFRVLAYHIELDTGGRGPAAATVCTRSQRVEWFEFRATDPECLWLPPWAAFPSFDSVTIEWRMGHGERYWIDWHEWYAVLSDDRKDAYQRRFPEPDRGAWPGYYALIRGRS